MDVHMLVGGEATQGDVANRVRGWLMRFNVEGTDGRTFNQDTVTHLDTDADVVIAPNTPILWRHGQGPPGAEVIGTIQSAERRDDGIWVEGTLRERSKYLSAVQDLLRRGALGWSAGSAAHLVEIVGKTFARFPVVEATLTPTPVQPLAEATQEGLSPEALALLQAHYPELEDETRAWMRLRIAIQRLKMERRKP